MAGKFGGRLTAWVTFFSIVTAACGDYNSNRATDPGMGGYGNSVTTNAGNPQVTSASGDLTQALAAYRAILGNPNTSAGEQLTGRREINWDGVPAALTNVDSFPGDQFNRVVPRGQVFTTEGTGFRVSDNALADLNPAYASEFGAFSPPKIFIAVGSRALTVHFQVAGSTTPALVNGFGVVFSDVDLERSTALAFFDAQGRLIKRVYAPVRSDSAGFSFVGVTFDSPIVARVRIVSGAAAITGLNKDKSAGGDADLVAMDDFIAGEPHAVR